MNGAAENIEHNVIAAHFILMYHFVTPLQMIIKQGAVRNASTALTAPSYSLIQRLLFSQAWFATPQDVLQADWQDVWHSPQPPVLTDLLRSRVFKVTILFIVQNLLYVMSLFLKRLEESWRRNHKRKSAPEKYKALLFHQFRYALDPFMLRFD